MATGRPSAATVAPHEAAAGNEAASEIDRAEAIAKAVALAAGDAGEQIPQTLPYQTSVREVYTRKAVQYGVAALIFGNFVMSAADKQLNAPPGSDVVLLFGKLEIFFAVAFGVELVINMYAHFFSYFWKSCVRCLRGPVCETQKR